MKFWKNRSNWLFIILIVVIFAMALRFNLKHWKENDFEELAVDTVYLELGEDLMIEDLQQMEKGTPICASGLYWTMAAGQWYLLTYYEYDADDDAVWGQDLYMCDKSREKILAFLQDKKYSDNIYLKVYGTYQKYKKIENEERYQYYMNVSSIEILEQDPKEAVEERVWLAKEQLWESSMAEEKIESAETIEGATKQAHNTEILDTTSGMEKETKEAEITQSVYEMEIIGDNFLGIQDEQVQSDLLDIGYTHMTILSDEDDGFTKVATGYGTLGLAENKVSIEAEFELIYLSGALSNTNVLVTGSHFASLNGKQYHFLGFTPGAEIALDLFDSSKLLTESDVDDVYFILENMQTLQVYDYNTSGSLFGFTSEEPIATFVAIINGTTYKQELYLAGLMDRNTWDWAEWSDVVVSKEYINFLFSTGRGEDEVGEYLYSINTSELY